MGHGRFAAHCLVQQGTFESTVKLFMSMWKLNFLRRVCGSHSFKANKYI